MVKEIVNKEDKGKARPPGWMKASFQCLISIRLASSLTFKPLLKGDCNSYSYHSDLNLLCYLPFLLIIDYSQKVLSHMLYSIKAMRQTNLGTS
jgi:hypothetical protein